jgi:hypothetical protein
MISRFLFQVHQTDVWLGGEETKIERAVVTRESNSVELIRGHRETIANLF